MGETLNILFHKRPDAANTAIEEKDVYEVQVRESWSGRTIRGAFIPPYTSQQLQTLRKKLAKLDGNHEHELREIGHHLFLALCGVNAEETPGVSVHEVSEQSVQSVLRGVIQRTLRRRGTIALTLCFEPECDTFAQYPWELLHNGDHFLLASGIFTLSRALVQPDAPSGCELPVRLPFRVLYIGASPCDCPPLETEKSFAALERGLAPLLDSGSIQLDKLDQATYDELVRYFNSVGGASTLNDGNTTLPCYVIHFDGHGTYGRLCTNEECVTMNEPDARRCSECGTTLSRIKPQTYLCFCRDEGTNHYISAQSLRELFITSDVRLAVFSACETALIAQGHHQRRPAVDASLATALIMSQVPAVVAMPFSVRDDLSPTFMYHFYEALAEGRTLDEGLARARQALLPMQQRSWFIPVLYRHVTEQQEEPVPLLIKEDIADELSDSTHPLAHMGVSATYIGRKRELQELDELLIAAIQQEQSVMEQPHLRLRPGTHHLVLTGTVGIGKSALAYEVVRRNRQKFPGGIIGISLQGGKSFGDALLEIMNVLHISLTIGPAADLQHRARSVLSTLRSLASRELPCLLFLDSFEEVKDHAEVSMWLHFLSMMPKEVLVFLTSRSNPEAMAVVDGPHCHWYEYHVNKMTNEDLFNLFQELASLNGLDHYIHLENPEQQAVLQEICMLLDGYPLGAELIFGAARTINGQMFAPEAATRSLTEIRDELRSTPLDGINAVLEVSYRHLSPYARLLMAYLAAFMLPFSKEQIVMLVTSPSFTEAEKTVHLGIERTHDEQPAELSSLEEIPLSALATHWRAARDELVQASFIQFDGRVYTLHPQIRHFALAHLPLDERQRVHHVVAAYYYNLPQPSFEEWMAAIEHLESAGDTQGQQEAIQITVRASWALGGRGHAQELLATLQRVGLHASRLKDKTGEGEIQCCLGAILRQLGRYTEAEACLRSSLNFHRGQQEREHAAWALYELAMLFREMGNFQQASTFAHEALSLFRETSHVMGEAWIQLVLGEISRGSGAYYEASGRFDMALTSFRNLNNKEGVASALRDRGTVYEALGQYSKAHRDYDEALRLFQELGLRASQAWVLTDMSIVYADQGKVEQAEKYCAEAVTIFREQGVRRGEGWALWAMGDIMRERHRLEEASVYYEEAQSIFLALGDRVDQARVLNALGAVAFVENEYLTAQECYEQAQIIAQEQEARQIYGRALRGLGDVARVMQRFADAERHYKQAFSLANELDTPAEQCAVLRRQGLLFQLQNKFCDALECWIHALALDMRLGHPARTYLQQSIDALVLEHNLQEACDTFKKQYQLL